MIESGFISDIGKDNILNSAAIEFLKRSKFADIALNGVDLESAVAVDGVNLQNAVSLLSHKISKSVLSISNVHLLSNHMQSYSISTSCRISEYAVNNSFSVSSSGLNATNLDIDILNINDSKLYQSLNYLFKKNNPVSVISSSLADSYRLGFFYISSISVERSLFKRDGVEILQQIKLSLIETKRRQDSDVSKVIYKSIY